MSDELRRFERSDGLQIGWVYTDKRGIDVLIVAKRMPIEDDASKCPDGSFMWSPSPDILSPTYPYKGVAMGNQLESLSYSPCGKFSLDHDQAWEKDLLVETGKLWVAAVYKGL